MNPPSQRFTRLRELFAAGTKVAAAELDSWLEVVAGDDPILRDELRDLLRAATMTGSDVTAVARRAMAELRLEFANALATPGQTTEVAAATFLAHHPQAQQELSSWLERLLAPTPTDDGAEVALPADPELATLPSYDGKRVLDPYVMLRRIGGGGFGAVYRARHLRLGTLVAVKVLQQEARQRPDARAMFEREARLGAVLRSRHLVHVTDCNRRHGLDYLVMEWVDGEDLNSRLRRLGPRPAREVMVLLHGIALGLAEVHGQGVLHRDIKPGNVLLARDGVVRLADLGLARHRDDTRLGVSRAGIGTPLFMAPEQREELGTVTAAADLYAVGATAFHLLTGEHAPRRYDPTARITLPLPADTPAELVEILERTLAVPLEERLADGAALLARTRAALARHHWPEQLTATEVALPSTPDDGIDAAQLARISHRVDTDGAPDQAPTTGRPPAAPAAAADGPPVPATPPAAAPPGASASPGRSRRAGGLVAVALLVGLGSAPWWWPSGPARTPGPDGDRPALDGEGRREGAPAPNPAQAPTNPSAASGPTPVRDAGKGATTPPPGPVPRPLVIETVVVAGALEQRDTEAALVVTMPPVAAFETSTALLTVVWSGGPPSPEVRLTEATDVVTAGSSQLQTKLRFGPGATPFSLQIGESRRTITLVAASEPPERPGLRLCQAEGPFPVHYQLPLPDAEPLRFVPTATGLLVGMAEVSRSQFLAFVRSDAFVNSLAALPAMQQKHPGPELATWLGKRRAHLLLVGGSDQPIVGMFGSEAEAFAAWAQPADASFTLRLPELDEWLAIANQNAGRQDPAALNGWPQPAGDQVRANYGGQPREDGQARLEPVLQPNRQLGELALFHLGGNAEELCLVRSQDQRLGRFVGGSFKTLAGNARLQRFPSGEPLAQLSLASGGFRLVIHVR